jgi:hypothetical protein
MARPVDPTSIASRIRQSFADGKPFVAYEAPADLEPDRLHNHLLSHLKRLRTHVSLVRMDTKGSCTTADYDRLYPGDAGFCCTAWAEPDLGCVYIGPGNAEGRQRRLKSFDARSSLAIGETAVVRLTRRSVRDINGWLRSQADLEWRKSRVAPSYTVAFADPADADLTTPQVDYLVTRGPDTTSRPGAVRPEEGYAGPSDPHYMTPGDPDGLTDEDIAKMHHEAEAKRAEEQKALKKAYDEQEKLWRKLGLWGR